MNAKATVCAPANIAFIKYWGAKDLDQAVPVNTSVSMTLSECTSLSTVEFQEGADGPDRIEIVGEDGSLTLPDASFRDRIQRHLERVRRWTGRAGRFRVATRNSFPTGAGLASSASGFAALAIASTRALGLSLDVPELSTLARMSGSGSAARSVLGGYVEWSWDGGPGGHATALAPAAHWDLRDVIAIVESGTKEVSSLEGHRRAPSSPHYAARLKALPARLDAVRRAIASRDLAALGPILEEEAIELHLIAMSSRPPIFYWKPGTLRVLEALRRGRENGLAAWATMDAGANVHVICTPSAEKEVVRLLESVSEVRDVVLDGVGPGPREEREHLF
ncbi:MAG TPA: diphosphomevalonate decarboxylase [Candidatus Polarisedimenticolaceae bacterium]|nr:diphosphomevalonate decarboxylase [Candidatus Polarisedimenticolaceae bacterium]